MYDGEKSPLTQTFGLGLFEPITEAELDVIESYYRDRNAPVFHEISPIAGPSLLTLLNQRNYHPVELTSVMYRRVDGEIRLTDRNSKVSVRLASGNEREVWATTGARGWSEMTELADQIEELMRISAQRSDLYLFLASLDDQPIGAAAMSIFDGVALMAGASTVPEARKRGAQLALLESRLRYAHANGCDVAMMGALPGSISQRNAERNGFRIAYTRIKWRLNGSSNSIERGS
jgi:hypothetical protein